MHTARSPAVVLSESESELQGAVPHKASPPTAFAASTADLYAPVKTSAVFLTAPLRSRANESSAVLRLEEGQREEERGGAGGWGLGGAIEPHGSQMLNPS
eukprot:362010-Chlamydomonas_euryale.AAC.6